MKNRRAPPHALSSPLAAFKEAKAVVIGAAANHVEDEAYGADGQVDGLKDEAATGTATDEHTEQAAKGTAAAGGVGRSARPRRGNGGVASGRGTGKPSAFRPSECSLADGLCDVYELASGGEKAGLGIGDKRNDMLMPLRDLAFESPHVLVLIPCTSQKGDQGGPGGAVHADGDILAFAYATGGTCLRGACLISIAALKPSVHMVSKATRTGRRGSDLFGCSHPRSAMKRSPSVMILTKMTATT